MNRYLPIILIFLFLFINSCKINNSPQKPNIIFIMSDDHAQKAISAYSSELIQTPNIDRIANEGMLFNNSYVTNSICGPSRATMLTGKYSSLNGLRDNRDRFDGSQQTFPKLLQKGGYHTSIVGKWHLKTEPTGFDNWKVLFGQGHYYNPKIWENGDTVNYIGYTTDLITDFAIEELDTIDKSKPFAMLIHHKAPHRNWMPNIKNLGAFDSIDIPLPETFYDEYETRKAAPDADMRIDDMYLSLDLKLSKDSYIIETGTGGNEKYASKVESNWENTYNRLTDEQKESWDIYIKKISDDFKKQKLSGKKLSEWKYKRYLNDYLSSILSVDESVGRILKYLDENGLSENTIVVYTSDQGFYLGEHGWFDKRWMYEESFRTPLVMRYPGKIKPNTRSDKFVINLDHASTFLDFAGVDIPADIQGESYKKIAMGNEVENWRNSIYYHYYEFPHGWHDVHQHYGIKNQRYKLIYFYELDNWELFDLEEDPNELKNIYGSMENSELVADLKSKLDSLKIKFSDTDL